MMMLTKDIRSCLKKHLSLLKQYKLLTVFSSLDNNSIKIINCIQMYYFLSYNIKKVFCIDKHRQINYSVRNKNAILTTDKNIKKNENEIFIQICCNKRISIHIYYIEYAHFYYRI